MNVKRWGFRILHKRLHSGLERLVLHFLVKRIEVHIVTMATVGSPMAATFMESGVMAEALIVTSRAKKLSIDRNVQHFRPLFGD